jgi:hypothetical protein
MPEQASRLLSLLRSIYKTFEFEGGSSFFDLKGFTLVVGAPASRAFAVMRQRVTPGSKGLRGARSPPSAKIKLISQEECDETREKSAFCRAHNLDTVVGGDGSDA